jgi:hypothetical protein
MSFLTKQNIEAILERLTEEWKDKLEAVSKFKDIEIRLKNVATWDDYTKPQQMHRGFYVTGIDPKVAPGTWGAGRREMHVWYFTELPGCCGVVVSHNAMSIQRKEGWGKAIMPFKEELAKRLGYTVLLCTDIANNTAENKILDKSGFSNLFSFKNKRTTNVVNIHAKDLRNSLAVAAAPEPEDDEEEEEEDVPRDLEGI